MVCKRFYRRDAQCAPKTRVIRLVAPGEYCSLCPQDTHNAADGSHGGGGHPGLTVEAKLVLQGGGCPQPCQLNDRHVVYTYVCTAALHKGTKRGILILYLDYSTKHHRCEMDLSKIAAGNAPDLQRRGLHIIPLEIVKLEEAPPQRARSSSRSRAVPDRLYPYDLFLQETSPRAHFDANTV